MEEKKVKQKKNSTAVDSKCPNCGGKVTLNPKLGKFKCSHCDSVFDLDELASKKNSAATKEKNSTEGVEEDENELFQYNCPDCGAVIVADDQTTATFCVYCGNTAILKNKLSGKFHPSSVIPFKKTVDDAKEAFKKISKGRIFVPKTFNNEANIEKIRGIYIPFWLYDITFDGSIKATGTKITTWRIGRTHYTKTDIYEMVRSGNMSYEKVPVDGSTRFDNDLMNSIEPFNYEELVEYNHAYLSGFLAERYDEEKDKCYEEAEKRIIKSSEQRLLTECTYKPAKLKSSNSNNKNSKTDYVLLPVYMVNVKYNGKMYTFAMNGQTGKFIGNIPLDKGKVALATIITPITIFILFEIVNFIIFVMRGGI